MILSVCDVPEVLKVMKIVKLIITLFKIAAPIILIVSLMIDYAKATMANENDVLVKTTRLTVNKSVAVVLLFMLPTFVNILTGVFFSNFSYSGCFNNATDVGIKNAYETVMAKYMEAANTNLDISSYNVAKDYIKHIDNEELKKKYEDELKVISDKIEEEKKKAKEKPTTPGTPGIPTTTSQVDPMAPYEKGLLKGDTFLQTARNVWERIVLGDKNFVYEQGNKIPIMTNECDCSSFVSWVLYEYGYEDFYGTQGTCKTLFKTNFEKKYGWEEYYYPANTDLTNIVEPGDIVVRRTEGSGHTDIIASVENGVVRGYDCGDSRWVKHGAYPTGIEDPYFIKDAKKHRPAKIIKVK